MRTPKKALQLIEKAAIEKAEKLDLGNCGLRSLPPELSLLSSHLKYLNIGESNKRTRFLDVTSSNHFTSNGVLSWRVLESMENLVMLIARNINIDDNFIEHCYSYLVNIERIDFSANCLTDKGAFYLSYLPELKLLAVSENRIRPHGAEHISKLTKLTLLDISRNALGVSGAEHISKLSNLTSLVISSNELDISGAEHISKLSNLTSLNISENKLDASGVERISKLSNLTSLYISNNKLDVSGAEHISRLSNLTSLYISSNKLGVSGAEHISRLSNLTSLVISSNKLGASGAEHISKLSKLTSLYTSNNELGASGAEHISKLSNLTSLYISNNALGVSGAEHISKLSNLTSLYIARNELGVSGAEHISRLSNLTSLYISNNKLGGSGAEHIGRLSNLTSLDISRNALGASGAEHISKLSNLTILEINGNALGASGAEHISKLSNLTSLYIPSNEIDVSGAEHISKLSNLTLLDVCDNKIGPFGAEHISKLNNLTSLDLSDNKVDASGAEHISRLSNLTSLYISNNSLGPSGAEQISKLSNLTSLYIAKNELGASGAEQISKLSNLTSLEISWNELGASGAEQISRLSNLTSLYISSNELGASGAEQISKLSNLTSLEISRNELSASGAEHISKLSNLTSLYISKNELGASGSEHISKLSNLTSLDISRNELGASGAEHISKLCDLTSLEINENKLGTSGAKHLVDLISLRRLYADDNEIGDNGLVHFGLLSKLEALHCHNNLISNIGVNYIRGLLHLKFLNLAGNKIESVQFIRNMSGLESAYLFDNPLRDIPLSLSNNIETIRVWLEEVEKHTEVNVLVKLIVNGNGNAGKSTMIQALKDGLCREEKSSTHGIVIDGWEWEEANQKVSFHVWDFGGQEIFHGTHRMFMQAQGVSISVFDPEAEEIARQYKPSPDRITKEVVRNHVLQYWLDESGAKSKRIVVQSKKSEIREVDIQNNKYAAENKIPFAHIDSKTGQGIHHLRSLIHEKGTEVTEYGMPMPEKWIKVRKRFLDNLQKEPQDTEKMISLTEFKRICINDFEIKEGSIPTLITFLHGCGVIYYNEEYLKETIIADQRWALNAIYKPLDRDSDFYRNMREVFQGRVRIETIYSAFGKEYTKPQKQLFVSLMESCGLCFKLNTKANSYTDEEWYVFPEFLPNEMTNTAKDVWEVANHNCRKYRLELPYVNYYRIQNFITAIGQNTLSDYIWRNGIMVRTDNGLFKVEVDYEKPGIQLTIDEKAIDKWLLNILTSFSSKENEKDQQWYQIEANDEKKPISLDELRSAKKQKNENGEVTQTAEKGLAEALPKVIQIPPKLLVISYAKEDRQFVNALRLQFSALKAQGKVQFWYDQDRDGRSFFDDEIKEMFNKADGYVLFVSPNYLDDEAKTFIHTEEIPIILQRKEKEKIPSYCITVTPIDYGPILSKLDYFEDKRPIPRADLEQGEFLFKFMEEVIKRKFLTA